MVNPAKVIGLAAALAGGVATSQAPEFAQQYRQRLQGALQEITQVVADFDADAARNGLERVQALAIYDKADEAFLRDRSQSIRNVIGRFEDLTRQSQRLHDMPAALRPVALFQGADGIVLQGTLRDYEPAVPVTLHGLIWTGIGFLLGFGLFKALMLPFRRRRQQTDIQQEARP